MSKGCGLTDWLQIQSDTGIIVPILPVRSASPIKMVLILLPALGIRGAFYRKLAKGLADHNIATIIVEQRGNGESPYRPARSEKFTLADYARDDMNAVVTWCQSEFPGIPLYIGGHSLGGHMASIVAGIMPGKFAGVVHLACGFPYYDDYPKPASTFVKMTAGLVPVLTALLGYYPGQWFKFGGKEFRGLMMGWREWALTGRYALPGIENADDMVAAFDGRAISIAFERDSLATDQAIERSRRALSSAKVTRLTLGEKEQGSFVGHVEWGKRPAGVVQALADWFKQA